MTHATGWDEEGAVELLSVDLLERYRGRVDYFRDLSRRLLVTPGWHYMLDWIWLDQHLSQVEGACVLDAGAGVGLMQWHLAAQGAHVTSIDRSSRAHLPLHLRHWYNARGMRPQDLRPFLVTLNPRERGFSCRERLAVLAKSGLGSLRHLGRPRAKGLVSIYTQDLASLSEISSDSVDAVVAVSSLEHNPPDGMQAIVRELWRVLRPGGALLATMSAAREDDWYHAPSRSHCYTEATLRRIFHLHKATRSNFAHYESILAALRNCAELRDALPKPYFRSGENGMPWGIWDPVYLPVGIAVTKAGRAATRELVP